MVYRDVVVRNQVGLHSTPASVFSAKAGEYKSSITIEYRETRANAKSLLNVLSLGIFKDMEIRIICEGPDENEALEGVCTLLNSEIFE